MNRITDLPHKQNTQRGFTLLEIMLVIAIIAAITVLGLSGYNQLIMNRKIQKASVEMQMWLQAGLKYIAETGQYPTDSQQIITAGLMQSKNLDNPWYETPQLGVYQVSTAPNNSQLLRVSTTIPTSVSHHDGIAKMLAGNLPFGINPTGTSQVYVDINPPPLIHGNSNTIIKDILEVPWNGPDTPIEMPQDCPSGYSPHVFLSVDDVAAPQSQGQSHHYYPLYYATAEKNPNTTAGTWNPTLDVMGGNNHRGTGNMLAIVTCEKNSALSKFGQRTLQINKSHYVF